MDNKDFETWLQETLIRMGTTLFELTGQKLFELFDYVVRNPHVTAYIRQVSNY